MQPSDKPPMEVSGVPIRLTAPGSKDAMRKEVATIEQETNTVELSEILMTRLSKLGIKLNDCGVIETDVGFAFATKKAVLSCVDQLEKKITGENSVEELQGIADALGRLAKAMSSLANKNFQGDAPPVKKAEPRRSFAAGQKAEFHVHYHRSEK